MPLTDSPWTSSSSNPFTSAASELERGKKEDYIIKGTVTLSDGLDVITSPKRNLVLFYSWPRRNILLEEFLEEKITQAGRFGRLISPVELPMRGEKGRWLGF